jgi:iron complex outermembrane receptor protein
MWAREVAQQWKIPPAAEARVAYYADGVYISRPSNVLGTLFDVSRIEVLEGPQGTLYGRNATAGAVSVVTNDPTDEPTGFVHVTLGNYYKERLKAR